MSDLIYEVQMVKIAVIGCGRWGKNLIRNFASLGVLDSVYCAQPSNAQEVSQQFGVPIKDFDTILQDPTIDAVAIATHTHSHYPLAQQAIQAGKHVYVEKPVALHASHAQHLVTLAQKYKVKLMTGHLLQYHPAYLKIKELIATSLVGKVYSIHATRQMSGRIRTSENVMWDLMPHDLSMILGLVGNTPHSVTAFASALHDNCYDTLQIGLKFQNNITAYVNASWNYPIKQHKFTVIGEHGSLIFDDTLPWEQKVSHVPYHTESVDGDHMIVPGNTSFVELCVHEPLKYECEHFVNCIQNNLSPITGPQEFMPVMDVCQEIQNIIDHRRIGNVEFPTKAKTSTRNPVHRPSSSTTANQESYRHCNL